MNRLSHKTMKLESLTCSLINLIALSFALVSVTYGVVLQDTSTKVKRFVRLNSKINCHSITVVGYFA